MVNSRRSLGVGRQSDLTLSRRPPPRLLKLDGSTGSRNLLERLPEALTRNPTFLLKPPPRVALSSPAWKLPPPIPKLPVTGLPIIDFDCTATTAPERPPNSAGIFPVITSSDRIIAVSYELPETTSS